MIRDTVELKVFRSENYNFNFRKSDGYFERWGTTKKDDAVYAPFPEIADIEITKDGCNGFGTKEQPRGCQYCYKSNTSAEPKNMSLETFKTVLNKLLPGLTQIAFGITSPKANPNFIAMMQYCREKGVIPNFTLSGADLDDEFVSQLPGLVGAVAVSYHGDKELCFRTVKKLLGVGIKQTNIHCVTVDFHKTLDFIQSVAGQIEDGLKLNALVLLSLKPKGRAKKLENVTEDEFDYLVKTAQQLNVPLGFDSCSAHRAEKCFPKEFHDMIEPCESTLFSIYADYRGYFHPCSFSEDIWGEGLDITKCDNFSEIWFHPRVVEWRNNLLKGNRECPLFVKEKNG